MAGRAEPAGREARGIGRPTGPGQKHTQREPRNHRSRHGLTLAREAPGWAASLVALGAKGTYPAMPPPPASHPPKTNKWAENTWGRPLGSPLPGPFTLGVSLGRGSCSRACASPSAGQGDGHADDDHDNNRNCCTGRCPRVLTAAPHAGGTATAASRGAHAVGPSHTTEHRSPQKGSAQAPHLEEP